MELTIKKILVPVDFSETSLNALDHAVALAKVYGAEVTVLNVVEMLHSVANPMSLEYNPIMNEVAINKEIAEKAHASLIELAKNVEEKEQLNIDIKTEIGVTHDVIMETAKNIHADIIVMGTHGASGIQEVLVGSNASKVVRDANCPVLTIRKTAKPNGYKNIVVPFRDKLHSRENVYPAIKIAQGFNATIHLIGVDTEKSTSHFDLIEYEVQQSTEIVKKHNVQITKNALSENFDSRTIIKRAQEKNADMIVLVNDSDEDALKDFFIGPISEQIVNHSHIPVLSIAPAINKEFNDDSFPGFSWE